MGEYLVPLIWIALGLVGLIAGGESLVRGASSLAVAVRISPLVVGLTVVAYGTSAPELAVGMQSGLAGQADIAVGNVVGSSICNVLLILGVSALIAPLVVQSRLIRFDVPLMIAVAVVLLLVAMDGKVSRLDGLFLFLGSVMYTAWTIVQGRKEEKAVKEEFIEQVDTPQATGWRAVLAYLGLIALGMVLLAVGADWLVDGSVTIARLLDVSELVIGLTIVAIGTSLPELVTSAVAAYRGARDIAVGNIVGSNIFNVLVVLGLTAVATPDGIAVSPSAIHFDIPVMIVVSLACLPVFFTGNLIARWEGGLFFAYYVVYMVFLVLEARNVPGAHSLAAAMIWFFMPLTAITLLVSVVRHFRAVRRPG